MPERIKFLAITSLVLVVINTECRPSREETGLICLKEGLCEYASNRCCCQLRDGIPKCYREGEWLCEGEMMFWEKKKGVYKRWSDGFKPVCASNRKSYRSNRDVYLDSCPLNDSLKILHDGPCDETIDNDGRPRKECTRDGLCKYADERCCCQLQDGIPRCLKGGKWECRNWQDPTDFAPVCASNGLSYSSPLELLEESCSEDETLNILHEGLCDELNGAASGIREGCSKDGNCKYAPEDCCCQLRDGGIPKCLKKGQWNCYDGDVSRYRPKVCSCGSDGKTYRDPVYAMRESCRENRTLNILYEGECDESLDSDGKPRKECSKEGICKYAPKDCCCQLRDGGIPKCLKIGQWECYDGPSSHPRENNPVCGSDGKTHRNPARAIRESCLKNRTLNILSEGECGESLDGDGQPRNECSKEGICKHAPKNCCCQLRDGGIPKCLKNGRWKCYRADHFEPEYLEACMSVGGRDMNVLEGLRESCLTNRTLTIVHQGRCDFTKSESCGTRRWRHAVREADTT